VTTLKARVTALERQEASRLPQPGPLWCEWEDGTRFDIFNVSFEDGGPGHGNPCYEAQDAEIES